MIPGVCQTQFVMYSCSCLTQLSVCQWRGFMRLGCAHTAEQIEVQLGSVILRDAGTIVLVWSPDLPMHGFKAAFAKLLRPLVLLLTTRRGSKRELRRPPHQLSVRWQSIFCRCSQNLEQSTHRPQDCYLFNGRIQTSLEDLVFQKDLRLTLRLYCRCYAPSVFTCIVGGAIEMTVLLLYCT